MRHKKGFLERFPVLTDLPGEPIPGQPIIELLGEHRVLIEKHKGVRQYCGQCVSVGMCFGEVRVHGASLELMHISTDQLIISGRIEQICVCRKESV